MILGMHEADLPDHERIGRRCFTALLPLQTHDYLCHLRAAGGRPSLSSRPNSQARPRNSLGKSRAERNGFPGVGRTTSGGNLQVSDCWWPRGHHLGSRVGDRLSAGRGMRTNRTISLVPWGHRSGQIIALQYLLCTLQPGLFGWPGFCSCQSDC